MKYETIKFNVGNEQYDVIHCLGDGQCECKSCKDKGIWSRTWTSWFYKLNETDENVLCRDCLAEILIQRRIDKAVKEIYSYLNDSGVIKVAPDTIKLYFKERYGVEMATPSKQKSRKPKSIRQFKQPHCSHCEYYKELTGTCVVKLMSFGLKDRAKARGSRNCSSFKPLDEYKDYYKELQK